MSEVNVRSNLHYADKEQRCYLLAGFKLTEALAAPHFFKEEAWLTLCAAGDPANGSSHDEALRFAWDVETVVSEAILLVQTPESLGERRSLLSPGVERPTDETDEAGWRQDHPTRPAGHRWAMAAGQHGSAAMLVSTPAVAAKQRSSLDRRRRESSRRPGDNWRECYNVPSRRIGGAASRLATPVGPEVHSVAG